MSGINDRPGFHEQLFGSVINPPNPRISEADFVRYFLPMFAQTKEPVSVKEWLAVSQSPFMEVDVMSGEEVLFAVPPLMRHIPLATENGPRDSISEISALSELKDKQYPGSGDRFLERALSEKFSPIPVNPEHLIRWNDIFKRYGYPEIVTTAEAKAKIEAKQNPPEDLVYEDF